MILQLVMLIRQSQQSLELRSEHISCILKLLIDPFSLPTAELLEPRLIHYGWRP